MKRVERVLELKTIVTTCHCPNSINTLTQYPPQISRPPQLRLFPVAREISRKRKPENGVGLGPCDPASRHPPELGPGHGHRWQRAEATRGRF